MTQAAYFNVHGVPLSLSAKDAVLAREPLAYAMSEEFEVYGGGRTTVWEVRRSRADGKHRLGDRTLASGANEESAWREALSRMRVEDEKSQEGAQT